MNRIVLNNNLKDASNTLWRKYIVILGVCSIQLTRKKNFERFSFQFTSKNFFPSELRVLYTPNITMYFAPKRIRSIF